MSPVPQSKPFLTAHWGTLLLLNYAVPADLLLTYLPIGCELDTYEGSPYVSLVAFQFTETRVFGIRWPGFTNFPEINLRFYVRHGGKRGVCFIREFVPSALIVMIARSLYNEPYQKAEMADKVWREGQLLRAEYTMRSGAAHFRLTAEAENKPHLPSEESFEHFFKEHELGVGRDRRGNTLTYRVHHPFWRIFPVKDYKMELDASGLYGADFGFLSSARPASVVFAEGSEITVYGKE